MEKEDSGKITPDPQKELSTNVVIGGKKYLVLTEDFGAEKHLIITRVYLGGEIISTKKTDYKYILNTPDLGKKLRTLMHSQHEQVLDMIKTEKTREKKETS